MDREKFKSHAETLRIATFRVLLGAWGVHSTGSRALGIVLEDSKRPYHDLFDPKLRCHRMTSVWYRDMGYGSNMEALKKLHAVL